MKFIKLTILLITIFSFRSHAQMAVTAPALELIEGQQTQMIGVLGSTLAAIEQTEKKIEVLKESVDWIQTLSSMQEFIQLLESTSCVAKDLSVKLDISLDIIDENESCLNFFKYTVNINKLRYVVDIVELVITQGFSMTPGERIESYNSALGRFETAMIGLSELDAELDVIVQRQKILRDQADNMVKLFSLERKY